MPNCYQLTPKDFVGPCPRPEALASIDEKICAHFGAVPHEKYWYQNWENNIGMLLACGRSWDEIKVICRDPGNGEFGEQLAKIAEFLEERYTVSAWAEIGRR
jgi:hypothetical protein